MGIQWKFLIAGLVLSGLFVCSVRGQKTDFTPKETVERLWNAAARGDLLTSGGWARASSVFTKPTASPGNGVVVVVSNTYGVTWVSVEGKSAKVKMEFAALGRINSRLRFTREPPTDAYETDEEYHLIASPKYSTTLPDGTPEYVVWRIEGSPEAPGIRPGGSTWTTVNTAIRYVLEQKAKTTDAAVKTNADETVKALLALH
jgi:hypothetical protein